MSFRVNLKGNDRLFGIEEFSLQKPMIRGYTWEPFAADAFKNEGLLVLTHKEVFLSVNGDNRGLYTFEETPSARTIEKQERKNGPIFGLNEPLGTSIAGVLDVYEKPFWENNNLLQVASRQLYSQFNQAQKNNAFSSNTFDMNEWAKYFALSDLFGSYHGTVPKSVKFYYNPTIGKFQPLLFDAHVGAGKFDNFILLDYLLDPNTSECQWTCSHSNFYQGFFKMENFKQATLNI